MKTLKYILVLILVLGTFYSCVDKETRYDLNDKGQNLAGFELSRTLVSGIADGTEYTFPMKVKVVGPSVKDLTSNVTLTVTVDEALIADAAEADTNLIPAIEGTHYRIDDPTVVLTKSNNYLGTVDVTMITEGLITPLPKSPILVLSTVSAAGDPKVTNNAKPITINLNFACFSEFQGTYTVTTTSSSGTVRVRTEWIEKIGVEQYLTQIVGTWNPPLNSEYGFTFDNACNVISVPLQGLADMYSNEVWSHKLGAVDPVTGIITIYYTIAFAAGDATYTAVYVPVVK